MKCKICGANLKKEGDICKNCYNEYKEYEKLSANNENELLKIKRNFSVFFGCCKYFELILLVCICSLLSFTQLNIVLAILITLLCSALFVVWMIFCKNRANGTSITFYETKLKYNAKYLFVEKEEIILYEDIEDALKFRSFSQRLFKAGDIRFYEKGFLKGLTISDVPNLQENYDKIVEIIVNAKQKLQKDGE